MTGKTFYWLAVFEQFTSIEVEQKPGTPGFSEAVVSRQVVAQKWNRSGTVGISPNQTTEDVVKGILDGCKEGGGVPADALLVNIILLPNITIPR